MNSVSLYWFADTALQDTATFGEALRECAPPDAAERREATGVGRAATVPWWGSALVRVGNGHAEVLADSGRKHEDDLESVLLSLAVRSGIPDAGWFRPGEPVRDGETGLVLLRDEHVLSGSAEALGADVAAASRGGPASFPAGDYLGAIPEGERAVMLLSFGQGVWIGGERPRDEEYRAAHAPKPDPVLRIIWDED